MPVLTCREFLDIDRDPDWMIMRCIDAARRLAGVCAAINAHLTNKIGRILDL